MLPASVLVKIKDDIPNWYAGMSIMELSHRSQQFTDLRAKVETDLRKLLAIPDSHKVLLFHDGARAQFSMVPINLLPPDGIASHVLTGFWSQAAYSDASQFGHTEIAATNATSANGGSKYAEEDLLKIPPIERWQINPRASYLFYTDNESANGLEFYDHPQVAVPLVADMTSNILTKPIDFSRFAVIFASAQKNIGIAGLTVVIVNEKYLRKNNYKKPILYDYHAAIIHKSMINTPPVFAVYVTSLMLEWMLAQGGVAELQVRKQRKAAKVYKFLDQSKFYQNKVDPACRSNINITFTLTDYLLEPEFIFQAGQRGLRQLQGHHSVGGIRVTLNNAMPESGVDALLEFMRDFEAEFG